MAIGVKIETKNGKTYALTPKNQAFIKFARNRKARWVAPHWVFDARDEADLRAHCLKIYGSDGTPCELVDVRYTSTGERGWDLDLIVCGRPVAFLYYSNVKTGDGVITISGKVTSRGVEPGTVFEIRDVPRAAFDRALAEGEPVTLVDTKVAALVNASTTRAQLEAEQTRLQARLVEIDVLLAKLPV